jgi:large subunit ribosomal protein L32
LDALHGRRNQEYREMPVQKSRKTPSKRGMHRSHDKVARPALSVDPQSGETHLRHCITPDGFYRGRRVIESAAVADDQD